MSLKGKPEVTRIRKIGKAKREKFRYAGRERKGDSEENIEVFERPDCNALSASGSVRGRQGW